MISTTGTIHSTVMEECIVRQYKSKYIPILEVLSIGLYNDNKQVRS